MHLMTVPKTKVKQNPSKTGNNVTTVNVLCWLITSDSLAFHTQRKKQFKAKTHCSNCLVNLGHNATHVDTPGNYTVTEKQYRRYFHSH